MLHLSFRKALTALKGLKKGYFRVKPLIQLHPETWGKKLFPPHFIVFFFLMFVERLSGQQASNKQTIMRY